MQTETQIKPSDIKILRRQLRQGDIKEIAGKTGYSSQAVRNAFAGHAITKSAREIFSYAAKLVQMRRKVEAELANDVKAAIKK